MLILCTDQNRQMFRQFYFNQAQHESKGHMLVCLKAGSVRIKLCTGWDARAAQHLIVIGFQVLSSHLATNDSRRILFGVDIAIDHVILNGSLKITKCFASQCVGEVCSCESACNDSLSIDGNGDR